MSFTRRGALGAGAALASLRPSRLRAADALAGIDPNDFRAGPDDRVGARSAAYTEAKAFLFDGLAPRYPSRAVRSVFVPMRDGIGLSTDFHIPLGAEAKLPVVLLRTPYGKRNAWPDLQKVLPEQGFIFAVQDVRGRHESEGEFLPGTGQDREDGYDTVSWIVAQPWSNGAVGAAGTSYGGETAAKLTATNHPALKASLIMFDGAYAGGNERNGTFLQGGINLLRDLVDWFRLRVPRYPYGPPASVDRRAWFRLPAAQAYSTQPVNPPAVPPDHLKTLPVYSLLDRLDAPPSAFADFMKQSSDPNGSYWQAQRYLTDSDTFSAAVLHVTGPQEIAGSGPYNFHLFRRNARTQIARDNQYLLFTPAQHSQHAAASEKSWFGARYFGDTRFPYYRTFIDWFDRWLRDTPNAVDRWPRARVFMGGVNRWQDMQDFPAPDVRHLRLYLARGAAGDARRGRLTRTKPGYRAEVNRFSYDPADPTPSEPPQTGIDGFGSGYVDRAPLEARPDILVYTTEPLEQDLELAGKVRAVLHVSSTAKDTDFVAILVEADAQGRAINVCHGAVRMRFREGLGKSVPIEPGRIYPIEVDMWFAALRIPAGHAIRLHIASAHFPHFDRNLNTGGNNYEDVTWQVAENGVHHGLDHLSYLELPVRAGTARRR